MSEKRIFVSQAIWDPHFNKYFHLYVYAESVEHAIAAAKSPACFGWVPLVPEDPLMSANHAVSYYLEAQRYPGVTVSDLFPDPTFFSPWPSDELKGPNWKAFFEVPENGDDVKTCGKSGCEKAIPNDAVRMVYEKEGERIYLCRDCAEVEVNAAVRTNASAYLCSREFLTSLRVKMNYEERTNDRAA